MRKFWRKEESTPVEEEPAITSTKKNEPVATNQVPVTASQKTDPQEQLVRERFPRMHAWIALTVLSIITLCSLITRRSDNTWVVIVSSVSLAVSFLTSVVYCIRWTADKFVDKIYEGIIAFLVLSFWIGGLPVIMDPSRRLAVTNAGELGLSVVINPNLYFFSWGSFACIFYICGSYLRSRFPKVKEASYYLHHDLAKWYILLAASIVVLTTSVGYSKSFDCGNSEGGTCKSNRYAQSLGAFSMVIALGIMAAICVRANNLNVWVQIASVVIVSGLYLAGVIVVTFDDGSGTSIGNLYFSIWIGFCVTVVLSVDAYQSVMDLWAKRRAAKKAASGERETKRNLKTPVAVSAVDEKGREREVEVESDIDENEFYEAKDEEREHFKYISNV